MPTQVTFNKKNENPFYGLRNCLQIYQQSTSLIDNNLLNAAYDEVKNDKQKLEMFYSLLFSIGDITSRQHNVFKGIKKDSGGNANRDAFYIIINWMINFQYEQFLHFLHAGLFNEYTCFDHLFRSRIQTIKSKVLRIYDMFFNEQYCEDLSNYIYKIINGNNPFDKLLVAKFLTLPRLSKRSKSKKMLPETTNVMKHKIDFLILLSEKMGWEYVVKGNYLNFIGFRNFRKQYNSDLESVLFSSGKIHEFDHDEFIKWFDKLPAKARFRVKNRILYSKDKDEQFKYSKLQVWYKEWEQHKESAQQKERDLTEKIRQGTATVEEQESLKKVQKEAKVTIGATNFNEIYKEICNGSIDKLKLESFMNKVNLPYNSLVIVDDSGSMRGNPFNFAMFMAAVCLTKNPDDDARNLLGFFNSNARLYTYIHKQSDLSGNSLLKAQSHIVRAQPFINPSLSFYDNYKQIESFGSAVFEGGSTCLNEVPKYFKQICTSDPTILDNLLKYPIWTVISDGDINSHISNEASMNDFFRQCENLLGFKPFLVCINIDRNGFTASYDRFTGIDNMMIINSNPAQIEQFLTNFKDMDMFDVYTPLQSIWRSNRYELIKSNIK